MSCSLTTVCATDTHAHTTALLLYTRSIIKESQRTPVPPQPSTNCSYPRRQQQRRNVSSHPPLWFLFGGHGRCMYACDRSILPLAVKMMVQTGVLCLPLGQAAGLLGASRGFGSDIASERLPLPCSAAFSTRRSTCGTCIVHRRDT